MIEYYVMEGDSVPNAEDLNAVGVDGWQMIQCLERHGKIYVYFSRAVVN